MRIRIFSGKRYNRPHTWAELEVDQKTFFLSFSEGQFAFWKDPELRILYESDSRQFAREYNAKGFGKVTFLEIESPHFYQDHHLVKETELMQPNLFWKDTIAALAKRIYDSVKKNSTLDNTYQNSTLVDDFEGPLTLMDWVHYSLIHKIPILVEALGPLVLPILTEIAQSDSWSHSQKSLAQSIHLKLSA